MQVTSTLVIWVSESRMTQVEQDIINDRKGGLAWSVKEV